MEVLSKLMAGSFAVIINDQSGDLYESPQLGCALILKMMLRYTVTMSIQISIANCGEEVTAECPRW